MFKKVLTLLTKRNFQIILDNIVNCNYKWDIEKAGNQQTTKIAGGSGEARTPDHLIKSQMLYQLSYRPATGDNQEYQKSNKCQLY